MYIEDNKSSHFNPLIDSMRIYFLLLMFAFILMFASAIDFVAFAITFKMSADILISTVVAKMIRAI